MAGVTINRHCGVITQLQYARIALFFLSFFLLHIPRCSAVAPYCFLSPHLSKKKKEEEEAATAIKHLRLVMRFYCTGKMWVLDLVTCINKSCVLL